MFHEYLKNKRRVYRRKNEGLKITREIIEAATAAYLKNNEIGNFDDTKAAYQPNYQSEDEATDFLAS